MEPILKCSNTGCQYPNGFCQFELLDDDDPRLKQKRFEQSCAANLDDQEDEKLMRFT